MKPRRSGCGKRRGGDVDGGVEEAKSRKRVPDIISGQLGVYSFASIGHVDGVAHLRATPSLV